MTELIIIDGEAVQTDDTGLATELEVWPGVEDPARLLAGIADWLGGYGNRQTRRTYAEGLGLPVTTADLAGWRRPTTAPQRWASALDAYAAVLDIKVAPDGAPRHSPPPAARGRLRHLHWLRWCAGHTLDPTAASSAHVKQWLQALSAVAAPATADRMLATVKALYASLADLGLVQANPAALDRRRLGFTAAAASTSSTITLTAAQVRALYAAAGAPRRGASPLDTARAAAIVALFTLGLRVSELCGLDEPDLHVTRGRRALRVRGKGGKVRVVYLSVPADTALKAYLELLHQQAVPDQPVDIERRGHPGPALQPRPLLRTRAGRRFQRQAIWQLLRRVAAAGGPELDAVAEGMHPHALRHFYVTAAVEAGAAVEHVQADVGHSSSDTTQQVYDHAARDPARSAVDLVAGSWHRAETGGAG